MSVDGRTDIDRSLAEGLLAMNQNGPDRSGGVSGPPVCTENLNTGVVVMKSAQDGA